MEKESIFKAYDIRGAYPTELNETIVHKIGQAYATLLNIEKIVVGRDMRLSSPVLAQAFIGGVTSQGTNVIDIGLCSSPMLYDAIIEGGFKGGAMITASHLPYEMNGLKLCRQNAVPLSGTSGLPQIKKMVVNNSFTTARKKGTVTSHSYLETYINRLFPYIYHPKPLKIVIDAGNGMAGQEISRLFKKVPEWTLIPMYMEENGHFPHHVPNPLLPDTTLDLQARVIKEKADIGVSFDGDVDRCGFIDEKGQRIDEDLVTALISEFFLKQKPGSTILYDLRSSHIVPEIIKKAGGIPQRCRVGHAFIKKQMRRENAIFAGELSGHYYYKDLGFVDNAMLTMIHMLNFLALNHHSCSSLVDPLKKYHDTGEINLIVKRKNPILKQLAIVYEDAKLDHLDGLTVAYPHWWFNVRKSNTEPILRLNLEAETAHLMKQKKEEVLHQIHSIDPTTTIKIDGK